MKLLRPETYCRVVRLLAEPREHVSYREICRQCHVTDDTVKAIEKCEAVPIAARKQELMVQAARIARLAADRVEDQISDAPLPQAVVTFGVMTDKVLALTGESDLTIHHEHTHTHQVELVQRFNETMERIEKAAKDAGIKLPERPRVLTNSPDQNARINVLHAMNAAAALSVPALPDASVANEKTAQKEG